MLHNCKPDSRKLEQLRARVNAVDISVCDLMTTEVVTLSPTDTLADAKNEMERRRIRHLPLVKDKQFVGLVSHRDLLNITLSDRVPCTDDNRSMALDKIPLSELMQDDFKCDVKTTTPNESARTAAIHIIERKIGCLPVINEKNELVGILTESDFVKVFSEGL